MTPFSLAAIPALLFGAGVISAVTGGGLGTIALLAQTFFLDIRTNVAITSLLLLVVLWTKAVAFRKSVDWSVVFWYMLLGLPGAYIGGRLLFTLPPTVPERGLGTVCLFFVVTRIAGYKFSLPSDRVSLILAGAINGFFGGLFGNTGLIMLPILFSMGFSKEMLVGTSAVIGAVMELGKASAYLPHVGFTPDVQKILFLSIPAIFIGVWAGRKILQYVSEELFEKLLLGVIAIGAVKLLLFP